MKKMYLLAVVAFLVHGFAIGQTAVLDVTFGDSGKVIGGKGFFHASALQADGKILVAGRDSMLSPPANFVARYTAAGMPDSSFGVNGVYVAADSFLFTSGAIAIDSSGKIVVGESRYYYPLSRGRLFRLNANGTADNSFGSNGFLRFYTDSSGIVSLAIQSDGKILAGGYTFRRFFATGMPDTSFHYPKRYNNQNGPSYITSIAIQPDGKLACAIGYAITYLGGAVYVSGAARFFANGVLDSAFGINGCFIDTTGTFNQTGGARNVHLLANGKLLLTGASAFSGARLVWLKANGTIDSTFGTNGAVVSPYLNFYNAATNSHIQHDGKIIITTRAANPSATGSFIYRFFPDGSPDTLYGRHGMLFSDLIFSETLLQNDEKLIGVGTMSTGVASYIAMARFLNNARVNYNSLWGYVFYDGNLNGVKDPSEPFFDRAKIITAGYSDTVTTIVSGGSFLVDFDSGTYVSSAIPYQAYFNAVPAAHTSYNGNFFNTDTTSFAMQPVAGKRDLAIQSFSLGIARPGRPFTTKLMWWNNGTDSVSNAVAGFIKDSRVNYDSAAPAPAFVNGDTLRWNILNLAPLDAGSIVIYSTVQSPPAVHIMDTLHFDASISAPGNELTPQDNTTSYSTYVFNSFDPNDKTESHAGKITTTQVAGGDYLTYIIRFQNTGNDTALNVNIHDQLDNKLDWNTFEMLTSSNNYQMTMNDGKCVWTFANIYLADSNHSEPASHGYLVYRIKPKQTVQVGDVVNNIAAIYFDYNLPVQTNTESTTVVADILPLRLLAFTAKKDGKTNRLQWSTSNEVNVDRFEVQRSGNGKEFRLMDKGQLTMDNGRHAYSFIDYSPLTTNLNYYRLTIVDKDGRFQLSPVRIVDNSSSFVVGIFPNPAKDRLQVQIESDRKTILQMQVMSLDGMVILSQQWNVGEGTTLQTLNVSALQSGSYFLKLAAENKEQSVVKFEKL